VNCSGITDYHTDLIVNIVLVNHAVSVLLLICQVAEYEQMAKDINRSAYTQRILEIVSNIRKQNQDIDKVGFCYCTCVLVAKCVCVMCHITVFRVVSIADTLLLVYLVIVLLCFDSSVS